MRGVGGKNLRLLGREPAPGQQPTIHEEIAALEAELARGAAVYAPAELRLLADKLAERQEFLRQLTAGG